MKTATVRDLRLHFPRIEGWLSEGEKILITKRKKVVAELTSPPSRKKPDFKKRFGGKIGAVKGKPGRSIVDILLEERGK